MRYRNINILIYQRFNYLLLWVILIKNFKKITCKKRNVRKLRQQKPFEKSGRNGSVSSCNQLLDKGRRISAVIGNNQEVPIKIKREEKYLASCKNGEIVYGSK